MSVDRLRDSANTRSQQRGGFKGEGDTPAFGSMATRRINHFLWHNAD